MNRAEKISRSGGRWVAANRVAAAVIGVGFVIVGVLRFVALDQLAGWETPEPIHGLLHLLTGAPWLAVAVLGHGRYAARANRWLGAFWLAVGIAGNAGWLDSVEALAFDDNAVHLIVGIATTLLGWSPILASAIAPSRDAGADRR